MYKIVVNGQKRTVTGPPDMPLLWALREQLGLTGTKFGCGFGLCGACTVHLDGVAVRACQTQIGTIGAQKVTTIEGLSPHGTHPCQLAWIAHDVPQCGYCQPGQIMSAAALLAINKRPSDDDITGAMEGNICRCGTYNRIRAAIKTASEKMAGGKS
ncbi:MAG: (2Fe-2S)-binding protein [Candidatus Sericytochromatia bacterium]|uniref:(2Fe-2S)-binding protein n=1 Tax=Candidatus Tanganyikabacteria bacterium TaxID=2961651 RepID=A0A937X4G5_9BACT|nr:(2Fe-2S)-binding protein [Candidatus Tanganyikabacteria bacterium]